jgi:ADP-ribose pyrophosphatase YjhB (NUDIX family)
MNPTSTLGVGCLLIENGQVLLVKPNYGKAKNHWILPGGFVENGEPLSAAALRELKEETNQLGELVAPFCVRYRRDPSDVYWVFRVQRLKVSPLVVQADELLDAQFLPIEFSINSKEVRPMTQYFIKCSQLANPRLNNLPTEFQENNLVYFFNGGN